MTRRSSTRGTLRGLIGTPMVPGREPDGCRARPMGRFVVSAPLICAFMNLHHKLRGELQLSGRMMNLVEDGVDVAIRIGLLADPGDIAGKVSAVRSVLGPAPADLATADTPDDPEALRDHRLIAFTGLTAQRQW
jgi:DNA-binding transcriptional LysR family regulator